MPTVITPPKRSRTQKTKQREALRTEYWPKDVHYPGPSSKGYFCAPRTLPLLLCALNSKRVSNRKDPAGTYVELLARHIDEGVVEMVQEHEHAFAAGYESERGKRSWRERMKILIDHGVIKVVERNGLPYGAALIVHPTIVFENLRAAGKVEDGLWNTYLSRRIETKEPSGEQLKKDRKAAKIAG